jgi:hypothetical protein
VLYWYLHNLVLYWYLHNLVLYWYLHNLVLYWYPCSCKNVQAGCTAGLMTVVVPRKFALQGTYPGVAAKVEGYGAGYATWNRLSSMLKAKQSS